MNSAGTVALVHNGIIENYYALKTYLQQQGVEFTSETVQFIGHFTPVAWMMDGFKDILARGAGLETVWLPAVVLLGFAVLFFSLGVWRFQFE